MKELRVGVLMSRHIRALQPLIDFFNLFIACGQSRLHNQQRMDIKSNKIKKRGKIEIKNKGKKGTKRHETRGGQKGY